LNNVPSTIGIASVWPACDNAYAADRNALERFLDPSCIVARREVAQNQSYSTVGVIASRLLANHKPNDQLQLLVEVVRPNRFVVHKSTCAQSSKRMVNCHRAAAREQDNHVVEAVTLCREQIAHIVAVKKIKKMIHGL
jgi:hypothetical protein